VEPVRGQGSHTDKTPQESGVRGQAHKPGLFLQAVNIQGEIKKVFGRDGGMTQKTLKISWKARRAGVHIHKQDQDTDKINK